MRVTQGKSWIKVWTAAVMVFLYASTLCAVAPKEISNNDTISTQLVNPEGLQSPYMVTGASVVGLIKDLADFDIEGTSVVFHRRTGKLFVKQTPQNHKLIEDVLAQIRNHQSQQIMIEARIVEVVSFEGRDIGVDWTNLNKSSNNGENTLSGSIDLPSGDWGPETLNPLNSLNLSYGMLKGSTTLDVTLSALEKDGKVKNLSSPKIICFNNQRANIKIETATDYVARIDTTTVFTNDNPNVNVSTDVETAVEGIVLDVTPSINTDGEQITLDLHPTVVELVSLDEVSLGNNGSIRVPKYVRRTADTTVKMKDGGTVVIGGLLKRTKSTDVRKVPLLGDIPLIKNLFRAETTYDQKSNLLIFITAKITS